MNSLLQLKEHGQSIWLDHLDRDLIRNGELKILVDEGEICGVTTNPDILVKAIASTHSASEYVEEKRVLLHRGNTPATAFEKLCILDIRAAADTLRPVYEKTHRRDGYVSLQISPAFADDMERC